MVYAGARNRTAGQMAATLHYTLPITTHHAAFNALDQRLNAQTANDAFRLETTNGMWLQRGFPFEPAYLETVAANYDLSLWLADFIDPEHRNEATRFINEWTAQQTSGRIRKILGPDTLHELTRLVLINAIYFQADWLTPFDEALTEVLPFTRLDETTVDIPQIRQVLYLSNATGERYQAVALPFDGESLRMIAVLPEPDHFSEIEAQLSPMFVRQIRDQLIVEDVWILLPRFQLKSKIELVDYLAALGMSDLFDPPAADLSGTSGNGQRELYVDASVHHAVIVVNEAGAEAAAATAAMDAAVSEPLKIEFNHPFIYWIEKIESGEILFLGRVMDPSQGAEE